jgi:hypothetical protein
MPLTKGKETSAQRSDSAQAQEAKKMPRFSSCSGKNKFRFLKTGLALAALIAHHF